MTMAHLNPNGLLHRHSLRAMEPERGVEMVGGPSEQNHYDLNAKYDFKKIFLSREEDNTVTP